MTTFLDRLSRTERAELEHLLRRERHHDGAVIFQQGDPASSAFLVRSGAVALELTLPGGAVLPVARLAPGALLGEPALLREGARQLSGRAVGDTELDVIEQRDFQGLRFGLRPVSFKIMLEIARLAGRRIKDSDGATAASIVGRPCAEAEADRPHQPLGATEAPGCAFDPTPYLARMPFFAGFSVSALRELLDLGTLWTLPRGRALLCAGERSQRTYAVVRGAVEARSPATGQRVALFGPGRLVGQLSPLLGIPVTADCLMREAGEVLELGPDALSVLLQPARRLSFTYLDAMCLGLFEDLSRANRVLARAESQRRLGGDAAERQAPQGRGSGR